MMISNFSKHIFWSYKADANLPDELVIKQVAIYGDIVDIIELTKLFSKDTINSVLQSIKQKNKKRVNFITKIFL